MYIDIKKIGVFNRNRYKYCAWSRLKRFTDRFKRIKLFETMNYFYMLSSMIKFHIPVKCRDKISYFHISRVLNAKEQQGWIQHAKRCIKSLYSLYMTYFSNLPQPCFHIVTLVYTHSEKLLQVITSSFDTVNVESSIVERVYSYSDSE